MAAHPWQKVLMLPISLTIFIPVMVFFFVYMSIKTEKELKREFND
jgi:protein-S-isoprenylcysteine O-methyltransferase Ste14